MNRIAVGVLVGGVLGILDGLTAWFTPEARPQIGHPFQQLHQEVFGSADHCS